MSYQAAVTAPHYLAAQAGKQILAQGGNAVEACVAMASALTVVYPHMTGLGGDGFWLIHRPGDRPVAINAAGHAAQNLTDVEFGNHQRGSNVALTTAGAVAGWQAALGRYSTQMPLSQIFAPAIECAQNGFAVSTSLHHAMVKLAGEYPHPGLVSLFFADGQPRQVGDTLTLPALAKTYQQLAEQGLTSWYDGSLAAQNAEFLQSEGSPVRADDIAATQARWMTPLSIKTQWGEFFNLGAPTQGGASLNIIGLLDQMVTRAAKPLAYWQSDDGEEAALHFLVEAVKEAFSWRNAYLSCDADCDQKLQARLTPAALAEQYSRIDESARPWPEPGPCGDTVWMGVTDKNGLAVSYIQSLYWEFGSGLADPRTGVVWNNRCLGFHPDVNHPNRLGPNRQPMHTLNPPLALLSDGSRLLYGTMGGEGQPQTQAAIIWRYLVQKMSLAEAIAAPRWLLGKTWGKSAENLKVGAPLFERVQHKLLARGHDAVAAPNLAEFFGHAGAVRIFSDSSIAASDPRSDGAAFIYPSNLKMHGSARMTWFVSEARI
ncbi:gamma-glutamyltransferase, partial [Vibrio sp. SM6]